MQTLELGNVINWKQKIWIVVGDDSHSSRHPNGACKKWDYILKDIFGRAERVTIEELTDIQLLQHG